jgi:hypothetical protein
MAIYKHKDNLNVVVRSSRKLYDPVGFKKGYNAVLAFISLGYILGFCLAQVEKFSVWGYWAVNHGPGETWAFERNGLLYKVSMTMHIVVMIPAGLIVVLQFLPFSATKHSSYTGSTAILLCYLCSYFTSLASSSLRLRLAATSPRKSSYCVHQNQALAD